MRRVKELAGDILNVGSNKIKINDPDEATEAITRDDIREMIKEKIIQKRKTQQASRGKARKQKRQKKKGRRKGPGRKKGTRESQKQKWMNKVRAQRKLLKEHKDELSSEEYRKLYKMIKGGYFPDKKHLKQRIEQ